MLTNVLLLAILFVLIVFAVGGVVLFVTFIEPWNVHLEEYPLKDNSLEDDPEEEYYKNKEKPVT